MLVVLSAFLVYGGLNLRPQELKAKNGENRQDVYVSYPDYLHFEDFPMPNGHKLINYWSDEEYREHLKDVDDVKMFGWNSHIVTNNVRVSYVRSTVDEYTNYEGTPIDVSWESTETETFKYNFSLKGSLDYSSKSKGEKNKESGKTLESGLAASIKLETSFSYDLVRKQNYTIKYKVDAGTTVRLIVTGTGFITNGVASSYFFWFKTNEGAFEIFVTSGEHYKFIKSRI
jgi:hypothetical protein